MAGDYFGDDSENDMSQTGAQPEDAEDAADGGADEDSEDDSSSQETFLVPKSALGGKDPNPGDVCKFKAVRSYDDEVEFEYVKDGSDSGGDDEMSKADAAMDKMGQDNADNA